MNRREFILGSATLAAGAACALDEKTTDGGFAPVSWPERCAKEVPVLPPGAHGEKRFASKCVGCALCAAACPSKCLRPSVNPRRFGRVELDYRHGWCKPGCTRCGEVCPAGAIEPLSKGEKRIVRVGRAIWNADLCLRTSEGVSCHACQKHCPEKAVKAINGAIVVNHDACVGCGACEHYCPARPQTAIRVEGFAVHHETRPMPAGAAAAKDAIAGPGVVAGPEWFLV